MPEMIELKSSISGKTVTFAQCMFGADWQKYTTFLYSSGFDEQLAPLQALLCTHPDGTHTASAGGVRNVGRQRAIVYVGNYSYGAPLTPSPLRRFPLLSSRQYRLKTFAKRIFPRCRALLSGRDVTRVRHDAMARRELASWL